MEPLSPSTLNPRIVDNSLNEDADENAPQDGLIDDRRENKPSTRERLDALSGLRILSSAIKFGSEECGRCGGKADVVQASLFRGGYSGEGELVAVKQLRNANAEKARREFVHEVELMAKMSHGNIVKFIGFVEDLEDETGWIVLSWEPNGNLSEFLEKGCWEIVERVSLIRDTLNGVRYLHTRHPPICHGDLKSLNILVSSSYRAIITDFGSAREINVLEDEVISDESGQLPTTGEAYPPIHVTAAGTTLTLTGPAWSLRWASPEVVNGNHPSLSSDIWAAGWVCWEVMTNTLPFHELNSVGAITLAAINGEVPSPHEDGQLGEIVALCTLMSDCWAFNPKDRPSATRCYNRLRYMPATPPSGVNRSGSKERSIQILIQKGWMNYQQSDYKKAALLLQQALSLAESAGNQKATADALEPLGFVYRAQSKFIEAEESYVRAKNIHTRIGNVKGQANALKGLGDVYRLQSNYTQAEELLSQAREVYDRIGNERGLASALRALGDVYCSQSKYTEAERSLGQAQEIYTRIGSDDGRGAALKTLGFAHLGQSKYTEAEQSFNRAQEIYDRVGNNKGKAETLRGLGSVYRLQSKYSQAEESYFRARQIYASIGDELGRAHTLSGIGDLRRLRGRNLEAASHYSEARGLYAQIGRTKDAEAISNTLSDLLPDRNSSGTSSQGSVHPNTPVTNISPGATTASLS